MKSNAPSFVASTAVVTVPWPEMMTTGTASLVALIRCSVSRPSIPGILTSRKIRSGVSFSARATPSGPLDASRTSYPSYSRIIRTERRISASSSMTRMRDLGIEGALLNRHGHERALGDGGIVHVESEHVAGPRRRDQTLVVGDRCHGTAVDFH